ncbi:50S ribosomal protein L2 [Microgenomates group bacterium RIFCSPLOWO2_01_FULL_46_13]|nr:ribosomal protein L2 [uncultured bacterium]OGV91370.1 MAG: 50S ribosomal protein L2 [Microgenomates group bacterium RIFCSPHIGHO2_01_FULL_45_11]OGV95116.1 MAG: 50S ribosomal protein L2 [Microgenomates group bacterium RIFCSPLOWO2_01_FULL_46_13]
MSLVIVRPTTPGRRHRSVVHFGKRELAEGRFKRLLKGVTKRSGRNSQGRVTVRHRGGGHKRRIRMIDFRRKKLNVNGRVVALSYDPNRSALLALIVYEDGDKRYILAPEGLKVGETVVAGEEVEARVGNALPLKNIPIGMPIHNLELVPGKGGQLVRGAGTAATIQAKEGGFASIILPSKEVRLLPEAAYATIGQLTNAEHKNIQVGKAGRKRYLGIRPSVRGVAMHPAAHPHGGGEGRSGIGMPGPKTPWGKPALGKRTRRRGKYSDRFIISRRSK